MKKIYLAFLSFFLLTAATAQIENPVKWSYSAKKISEMLKNAIGMEREAYGLDSKAGVNEAPGSINISF